MGGTPKPYQEQGIDFLAPKSAAILADDAGLGKSLQLIRAANRKNYRRILILTPAIGRVSWAIQFGEWDLMRRPVYIYPDDTAGMIPAGPCVVIVTQDWLADKKKAKSFNRLLRMSEPMDLCVIDEAHYLKSPDANRTRAIYGGKTNTNAITGAIPTTWIATATPTPLNAGELYSHMRALFPETLTRLFRGRIPTHADFQDRFCYVDHGIYGRRVRGNNPRTILQLRDALRPFMLARHKADVLPELDPITPSLLPLEIADSQAIWSALHTDVSDDEFLATLASAYSQDYQYSTARRALGLLKADVVTSWVLDFLKADKDRKLVVFAHHRDVIAALFRNLYANGYEASTITGGTPANTKADMVDKFQNGGTRLFLGQTRAAGTAITLTAASTVLMLEPDPSPDNNYQAISRAHRIGQKDNVTAHFAYSANNPIERRLAQTLMRRASDNADLFGVDRRGYVPTDQQPETFTYPTTQGA